jgi:hypothetical protein
MYEYRLTFTLQSDATFGRGEGIAGLLDREVEHDRYGLPYLRGRTLKGLVSEEADNVLFALERLGRPMDEWRAARQTLFGRPGSVAADRGRLRFGHAELPADVRQTVQSRDGADKDSNRLLVLESLTTIRRQTAIEADGDRYGVPAEGSLRAMRVILRQTPFEARLWSEVELEKNPFEWGLLAAAVLAFRRAGTGRNRGRGKLTADLSDAQGNSLLAAGYEYLAATALTKGQEATQ